MPPKKPPKPKGTLLSRIEKGDKRALRIARSNPGSRSKLPDKYLTPEQRRQRAANAQRAYMNDPAAVTAPRTLADIEREGQAAANLRYRPTEQALVGEQRVSDVQGQRIGSYFDQYKAELQRAEQAGNAQYATAVGQQQAATAATATADEAQRAALDEQMRKDAAARGATAAPSTAAQQGATVRRQIADTYTAQTSREGASRGSYLADRGAISVKQKIEAQQEEDARRRGIDRDIRDIKGQRGDFASAYRAKGVDRERTYGLERAAFGLNTQKAAADVEADKAAAAERAKVRRQAARDRAAGRNVTTRGQNINAAQREADRAVRREATEATRREKARKAKEAAAAKETKRIEGKRTKTKTWVSNIETNVGWLRTRDPKKPELFGPGVRDVLLAANNPPAVVDAAIEIYKQRKAGKPVTLSPGTVRALQKEGISVPRKWLTPTKPLKPGVGGTAKPGVKG